MSRFCCSGICRPVNASSCEIIDANRMIGYLKLLFSDAFSVPPALNTGTLAALICRDSPFLGLRPMRAARSRTSKVPNPDNLIFLPFFRVLLMTSISAATLRSASTLLQPTLSANASMSSFLFIISPWRNRTFQYC